MKAIVYSVIAIAAVLTLCFIVSLIRSKTSGTKLRWTNLILPLMALLLFVGLFVGSVISRNHLRKELVEMKENTEKREERNTRLAAIEKKNNTISYIIGRDEETEVLIEELRR